MNDEQTPAKIADSDNSAIDLLKLGLEEAQATVRAYDTKAQIVGVGYIFALGIVGRIGDLLPGADNEIGALAIGLGWLATILPIVSFGAVLYPTRKAEEQRHIEEHAEKDRVLFVDLDQTRSAGALAIAAKNASPIRELAYELITVSRLRDLKRKRFLRGLLLAGVGFLFLFAVQVLRGIGL
ncbi:MAG: hypothetical protein AAGA68_25890 [Pseudomonadota bacterium]